LRNQKNESNLKKKKKQYGVKRKQNDFRQKPEQRREGLTERTSLNCMGDMSGVKKKEYT
jgi:hypothetical protein